MATQTEWESDCKINLPDGTSCGGSATVLEVDYDANFTAWLVRVSLAEKADYGRFSIIHESGVGIVFSNGRSGHAKLVKKVADDSALCYFVGLHHLAKI